MPYADAIGARFFTAAAADAAAAAAAPAGDPKEWGADEVQAWFQAHEDGIWAEYAPKFARLTGAKMSALEKEDFLRRVPDNGDVIYNDWRARLGAAGAWRRRRAALQSPS